jgi:hypothetical protein
VSRQYVIATTWTINDSLAPQVADAVYPKLIQDGSPDPLQLDVDVLPRDVIAATGRRVPIGLALVLRSEAELFDGFDPVALYKHIAGLNAIRLRHALQFAYHQHQGATSRPTFRDLLDELRTFKAKNSRSFEVPNVDFDQINFMNQAVSRLYVEDDSADQAA